MGLFYGSQKSTPATQLTLFIDKVYNNRKEMEEAAGSDQIFVGRYVLIAYNGGNYNRTIQELYESIRQNADGDSVINSIENFSNQYSEILSDMTADEQEKADRIRELIEFMSERNSALSDDFITTMNELSTINDMSQQIWDTPKEIVQYNLTENYLEEYNAHQDVDKYGERFNHTIWMKQYTPSGEKYLQIGSLDARMAHLTVKMDLLPESDAQVDQNDATWEVTIHMPKMWKWNTDPENIDIGAELFDPHWRESSNLSEDAQKVRDETENDEYTLTDYIGTPSLGFESDIDTATKTLKGNLRILGGLVEQAYEIIYGHEGTGRNTIKYAEGVSEYNNNSGSLLGLLNIFLANTSSNEGAEGNSELDTLTTAEAIGSFIKNLTNASSADIKSEAGTLGSELRTILNNIVQQIIGLPNDSYIDDTTNKFDFISQRIKYGTDNSLIQLLNNKHHNELENINDLLSYLELNSTEPILNLYTLTMLGKYLLNTMNESLTSISKPNHLKAFKFNSPVGGSLKNNPDTDWRQNLDFHIYLENNQSDGWFRYARGGILVTVEVDNAVRCLAYLPRKVNENDPDYFSEKLDVPAQWAHFNVDLSENANQEGWLTWRNHPENSINTGNKDFDELTWANETIVNRLDENAIFIATVCYNINGVFLYEQKKLKLVKAPYYLFVYDTCTDNDKFYGDNFNVTTMEDAKAAIETIWTELKGNKGWNETTSVNDVEFISAKDQYTKALAAIVGDQISLKPQIQSLVFPMNTGDIRREYQSVAQISDEQNNASRDNSGRKYVYIFSRYPVGETIVSLQDEEGNIIIDEEGNPKYFEKVLSFKAVPAGVDMGAVNFTGGFTEKQIVYTDTESNFTYNYLYRSIIPDPIDVVTHSTLEMIIIPEPNPEDINDITLQLSTFVGAKDTNADLNIAGYDGIQGVVPQPVIGDQYAYLMGNGEWSHLRANAGLEINIIPNENNKDELTIQHQNVYTGNSMVLSTTKISSSYASDEERIAAGEGQSPSGGTDSTENPTNPTVVTYHRHLFTTTTTTKRAFVDEAVVESDPITTTMDLDKQTFEASNNPDFSDAITDVSIAREKWDQTSEEKTADEVIAYFKAQVPDDTYDYELIKTVYTERLWDDDYSNNFPAQEGSRTVYEIKKINKKTNETIILPPIAMDGEISTNLISTGKLGFGCTVSLPCFTLDKYGHILSTWNEDFKFFDVDQFKVTVDTKSCILKYQYDSGLASIIAEIPTFVGISNETKVGKVGLVPAPGVDITKSVAYQNEFAYLKFNKLDDSIMNDVINYIKYSIILSLVNTDQFRQIQTHTETAEKEINDLIGNKFLEATFNFINYDNTEEVKSYDVQGELQAVYPAHFFSNYFSSCSQLNRMIQTKVSNSKQENDNQFSFWNDDISISSSTEVIKNSYQTKFVNNQDYLFTTLQTNIDSSIEELKDKYDNQYAFLQGDGNWGPVMYDYEITLEADNWVPDSTKSFYTQTIVLPGLKHRFGTFAELDLSLITDQVTVNNLLEEWQQIDKITIQDDILIAECVAGGAKPAASIKIIVKVVIR